jgi:hypothetical protein
MRELGANATAVSYVREGEREKVSMIDNGSNNGYAFSEPDRVHRQQRVKYTGRAVGVPAR